MWVLFHYYPRAGKVGRGVKYYPRCPIALQQAAAELSFLFAGFADENIALENRDSENLKAAEGLLKSLLKDVQSLRAN